MDDFFVRSSGDKHARETAADHIDEHEPLRDASNTDAPSSDTPLPADAVRASAYWLALRTTAVDATTACDAVAARSRNVPATVRAWTWLAVLELLASATLTAAHLFALLNVGASRTRLAARDATALDALTAGPMGLFAAALALAVNALLPFALINPAVTLYRALHALRRTSTDVLTRAAKPRQAARALLRRRATVLVGHALLLLAQLLGAMLAALLVFNSDYGERVMNLADAATAAPAADDAAPSTFVLLHLVQTVPNTRMNVHVLTACTAEGIAMFGLLLAVRHGLRAHARDTLHRQALGDARADGTRQWKRVNGGWAVTVVRAVALHVLYGISGGSLNCARSFGAAWYVHDRWTFSAPVHARDDAPDNGVRVAAWYALAHAIAAACLFAVDAFTLRRTRARVAVALNVTPLAIDKLCADMDHERHSAPEPF